MIFARLHILAARFGHFWADPDTGGSPAAARDARAAAGDMARRWRAAFRDQPELAHDIIRLGGILQPQPVIMDGGMPVPAPVDPARLAYEAGQRDLAQQLLALGHLTVTELNQLIED